MLDLDGGRPKANLQGGAPWEGFEMKSSAAVLPGNARGRGRDIASISNRTVEAAA